MNKRNKFKILKIILVIAIIAIIIGIISYLFPVMKNLSTLEGQLKFKNMVKESGIWGMLSLFGLELAQIFLMIIPGEPIEILAGMCYGGLWGTIFIMVSACIITTVIFLLVRKFGRKFVYNFYDKRKVKKIENNKLFQNPRKLEIIMFILFLIPGTPKDFLIYIAALLPVKPLRFICITTIARFPSVVTSTLAGKNLILGDWKTAVMLYAGIIILVVIFMIIFNKFDKDKITEDAINSIK